MIAPVLLASWLASQQWEWDEVVGATSYRIRWGVSGKSWCTNDKVDVMASVCTAQRCAGDIPMPPEKLVFIVVTSIIGGAEQTTEHGPIAACP